MTADTRELGCSENREAQQQRTRGDREPGMHGASFAADQCAEEV
jgi:hypothetical protein